MARKQTPDTPQTSQPCDCGAELAGVHFPTATNGDHSRKWIERCDTCAIYDGDQEAAEALIAAGIIEAFGMGKVPGSDTFHPFAIDAEHLDFVNVVEVADRADGIYVFAKRRDRERFRRAVEEAAKLKRPYRCFAAGSRKT